jgi:hypothetical protein
MQFYSPRTMCNSINKEIQIQPISLDEVLGLGSNHIGFGEEESPTD